MEFPNVPNEPSIEVTFKVYRMELDHLVSDLAKIRDPWNETIELLDYLRRSL